MKKRIFALAMSICMVLSTTSPVFAEDTVSGNTLGASNAQAGSVVCENHMSHDKTCGYLAPSEEQPCAHMHDSGVCGYTEGRPAIEGKAEVPCDKACEAAEATPADAAATVTHVEGCAYSPAVEAAEEVPGTPCTHIHDEACGYAQAVAGAPCTHVCELCATTDSGPPMLANTRTADSGTVPMPWGQSFEVNRATKAATTQVYYGGAEWLVIGADETGVASESGTMTLLAKDIIGGTVIFDDATNNYGTADSGTTPQSNLKTEIDELTTGSTSLFTAKELAAMNPVTLTGGASNTAKEGMFGDNVTDALLWPLDVAEATALGGANTGDTGSVAGASNYWWLRSPGDNRYYAAFVNGSGNVDSGGDGVSDYNGVRPAFQLNLDSVLFSSAAAGGKSGAAGATLSALQAPTVAQKLTVLDSALYAGTVTATGANTNAGTTIKVSASGATEDKSLSAIITDSTGKVVKYYGKIADTDSSGAVSNADLTLPVALDTDNVLHIFVEEINGNNTTDYASTPVAVTVTPPTTGTVPMPWGQSFEVNMATKDATTQVWYGGTEWLVIGADETGVASNADTMTLFKKTKYDGTDVFNYNYNDGNAYAGSHLKDAMRDRLGDSFTAIEVDAMAPRDLSDVSVTDAKLWPLNVSEANALAGDDIRSDSNDWWLRSPVDTNLYNAAFVRGNGSVNSGGFGVNDIDGVRPAFLLNLSSVLFSSAAAGGKSGAAGATLSALQAPTGAQKLTVLDSALYAGTVTATGANTNAGTKIKVSASGATADKSLSAIITDSTGKVVKYYGKIADTDSSGAVSNADLTLPVDLDNENVLHIFVEEINGEKKTDYASTPVAVAVTPPTTGTVPMPWGQDFEVNRATKANTTQVWYGGTEWLVIGADETGVASESGAMTLLAKDIIGGNVQFDDATNNYGTADGGTIPQSNLKTEIDELTTGSTSLFTAKELAAMNPVTLTGGASNTAKEGMFGDNVTDALLWPLDVAEANALGGANTGDTGSVAGANWSWWLRSPGDYVSSAAFVYINGSVISGGDGVDDSIGVRPAFQLNLDSVLFSSAAAGGKSGAAGATLSALQAPTVAQKLTVLESTLYAGTVTATGANTNAGTTIKVSASRATADKSLSAIITDSTGKVIKYYGKIADTDSSGAVSNADLTLPVDLDNENVLHIFVEEINGEKKTDCASTPMAVTVDTRATTHTITFDPQGGTVTPASVATGPDGKLQSLPTPARSGSYRFDGWFTATTGGTKVDTSTVFTSNSTIFALWTYTGGGGGDPSTAPTISTLSLPSGKVGTAYSQQLTASGTTPITWSITSGTLPKGLTLSGNAISGTPQQAETATFTVQAANGTMPNAAKELSITILPKDTVQINPINPPNENKPIDTTKDLRIGFDGEYGNLASIKLNGTELARTVTSPTSCDLSGFTGYNGVLGKAESGSVYITLYKAFVQTLPNGKYVLEVTFEDGTTIGVGSVPFTIQKGSTGGGTTTDPTPTPKPTPDPTPTPKPSPDTGYTPMPEPTEPLPQTGTPIADVPKTGDSSDMGLWITLLLLSIAGAGALTWRLRKKRTEPQE